MSHVPCWFRRQRPAPTGQAPASRGRNSTSRASSTGPAPATRPQLADRQLERRAHRPPVGTRRDQRERDRPGAKLGGHPQRLRGSRNAGSRCGPRARRRPARRCGSPSGPATSRPVVATAAPAGSPRVAPARSARQARPISGPPARWIAPSTPEPPSRLELAAFTTASTCWAVMSPSTTSNRIRSLRSAVAGSGHRARRAQASGSSTMVRTCGGSSPDSSCCSEVSSSTRRRLARTATHSPGRCSARPV